MAIHNDLGREGEEAAALYLSMRNYRLLDKNWRMDHRELDLVAESCGLIIFVEVKTRSTTVFGSGAEAVDARKQRFLISAARAYLTQHKLYDAPIRFDVITVTGRQAPFEIHHIKGAFDSYLQEEFHHEY